MSDKEAGIFSFVKFGELLNDFLTFRFETGEAASESGKHLNVKKKDVVRARRRRRGVFLLRDIIIDKTENPACFMKQSSNIIISQHEVPRIHPPRSVNFSLLLLLLLLRGCSWKRTTLPHKVCANLLRPDRNRVSLLETIEVREALVTAKRFSCFRLSVSCLIKTKNTPLFSST